MTVGEAGEEAIIQLLADRFAAVASPALMLGMGDDGALLRPAGDRLQVVTTDLLLAGTHFSLDWAAPDLLGRKALAVNLSDLQAMGAVATAFFLDLGLPPTWPLVDLQQFLAGLSQAAVDAGGIPLAGGDTCRAADLHIGITMVGEVHPRRVIRRSGGQVGDVLAVSGGLGGAAAGLHLLRQGWRLVDGQAMGPTSSAVDVEIAGQAMLAHLAPAVPAQRGQDLGGVVSAGMDLSDGLAADLPRLCRASRCGARVDLEQVPVAAGAREVAAAAGLPLESLVVGGGEDYQLLLTIPPSRWNEALAARHNLFAVGRLLAPEEGLILRRQGRDGAWPSSSFTHFAES